MKINVIRNPLGFWEIKDKPSLEKLTEYYSKKYYQEAKGSYEKFYTKEELNYFQHKLEQRYRIIQKIQENIQGFLLDVGCGEGYCLSFFKKKGWNVKGLDFSSAGIQSKNPDCLKDLKTGNFFELIDEEISSNLKYDVIWLQNVLEHVIDPIDLLNKLTKIITKKGLLVITVPNDFSITQLEAEYHHHIDNRFWISPPDHLNYFNSDTLPTIAEATGWKCQEMLGDFPIDWFIFHPGSNYILNKNAGKKAHLARIQLENAIHKKPIDEVNQFWSAMAKMGMCRNISVFFQLK